MNPVHINTLLVQGTPLGTCFDLILFSQSHLIYPLFSYYFCQVLITMLKEPKQVPRDDSPPLLDSLEIY
jgi:hypothetical protein